MNTYFFKMKVIPTSATPKSNGIAGANAHIWVRANSQDEAEIRALSHLIDYAWIVQKVEIALQISYQQVPLLDIRGSILREKVLREGLGSEFVAWPIVEMPANTPPEARSMGPPLKKSNA
jgi:hypothetical protein